MTLKPSAAAGRPAAQVSTLSPITAWRSFRADPLEFLSSIHASGSDLVDLSFGPQKVCVVCAPSLAFDLLGRPDDFVRPSRMRRALAAASGGASLFTLDGEAWRQRRRIVAPRLSRGSVLRSADRIEAAVDVALGLWPDTGLVQLGALCRRLTLAIAVLYLFDRGGDGVPVEALDRLAAPFERANDHATRQLFRLVDQPSWWPSGRRRQNDADIAVIRSIIDELVRTGPAGPVVEHLRQAGLSPDDTVSELLGLLFAGHETTASALTFGLLELASRPDAWDAVARGARSHGATEQAGWCVSEILRLYPPVWGLIRQSPRPVELGGRTFGPGTFFIVSIRDLHRSGLLFDDPLAFRPERHAATAEPEEGSPSPAGALIPFGRGERFCVGSHLATAELAAALTAVTSRYEPFPGAGRKQHKVQIRMAARPDPDPWVRLIGRAPEPAAAPDPDPEPTAQPQPTAQPHPTAQPQPTAQPEPVVRLIGVSKVYGEGSGSTQALDGVDLTIPAGRLVVIVGPSGCGKSTLLNLIGGIDRPTSGQVMVGGESLTGASRRQLEAHRRTQVAFVFQFYNLVPTLTAIENIEIVARLNGTDRSVCLEALEAMGVADLADRFPRELSGGQQQRVAIARALAKRTPLVLCDEPTGALDRESGRMVATHLRALVADRRQTVIVVTHDESLFGDDATVVRMVDGRVMAGPGHAGSDPGPGRAADQEQRWAVHPAC